MMDKLNPEESARLKEFIDSIADSKGADFDALLEKARKSAMAMGQVKNTYDIVKTTFGLSPQVCAMLTIAVFLAKE